MRRLFRTFRLAFAGLLVLGLALPAAAAGKSAPWLHLRVTGAEGAERVNLNVPFSLAEGLIDMADANSFTADLQSELPNGMSLDDIRQAWKDLKHGGQEFLNVDSEKEQVRMAVEGDALSLRVSELVDGLMTEKVRVRVPSRVVDALLSGQGEELDLRAALDELKDAKVGEILSVDDGDESVRLWIE